VLQHFEAGDQVEGAVREGQPGRVIDGPSVKTAGLGLTDRLRGDVDAYVPGGVLGE
jgi:hypothetical protein